MEINPKYISWCANGILIGALITQVKGLLNFAFPLGLAASILFCIYGVVVKDYSFVTANALIFIPINLYGSLKWMRYKQIHPGGKKNVHNDYKSVGCACFQGILGAL